MFDPETEKTTEQRRSRLIMALGAVGAVILAFAFVIFTRSWAPPQPPPQPQTPGGTQLRLENALRAGSPEFDDYKAKVTLEDQEVYAAQNLMGMTQFTVRARLHNRGDRALAGIELVGKVYDLQDKIVAQNTGLPIPRVRSEPLQPGESFPVLIKVDVPSNIKEADVKEVKIELQGLRFQ
jgi:hypothetical protein